MDKLLKILYNCVFAHNKLAVSGSSLIFCIQHFISVT